MYRPGGHSPSRLIYSRPASAGFHIQHCQQAVLPVTVAEANDEKWGLQQTLSPAEGEQFQHDLGNYLGYETGSVNLAEGTVLYHYQKMKDGEVYDDYVIETLFDRPPPVLIPGETVTLNFSERAISWLKSEPANLYSYSVQDSTLGQLALARIDRMAPATTLTFTVPETHDGEITILFWNEFFEELMVEWRYRLGGPAAAPAPCK